MSKTVLIIDDSESMRELLKHTLVTAGYEVREASNGADGMAEAVKKKVDLIITDLNMPVMDGLTVARKVRQIAAYRTTPLLLLTTETSDAKKQAAREAGASGWMVKPFSPPDLLKTIARVMPR
ncbi:MAG: response regulator [Myxococcales bacterium]|nr:response regulator [Myxococcales bacterium]